MAEVPRSRLPSGYDEDFVTAVEHENLCLICHSPLKEPVQTRCGHRFCIECLEEHFRRCGLLVHVVTCKTTVSFISKSEPCLSQGLVFTLWRKHKLKHKEESIERLGYEHGDTGIKLFLIQSLRSRFSAACPGTRVLTRRYVCIASGFTSYIILNK